MRRVVAADRVLRVDLDLDVQAVVTEQHDGGIVRAACVADEQRGILRVRCAGHR